MTMFIDRHVKEWHPSKENMLTVFHLEDGQSPSGEMDK